MSTLFRNLFLFLLIVLFIIIGVLHPDIIAGLLVINLLVLLVIGGSRLVLASKRSVTYAYPLLKKASTPKVSIHLPVCHQSPKIVCNTIRSIVNQTYDNFEIIVLLHETPTNEDWLPIKNYCNRLGKKVKFINSRPSIKNKVDALNLCRKYTASSATYILTVGSDYWLEHHSVSKAINLIKHIGVDLLLFPKAYFNINNSTTGLKEEIDHFFNCYSSAANSYYYPLPTENTILIKKEVLDAVRGWSHAIGTEETQLGARLLCKGYSTFYCKEKIGRGIMPYSIQGINDQKSK